MEQRGGSDGEARGPRLRLDRGHHARTGRAVRVDGPGRVVHPDVALADGHGRRRSGAAQEVRVHDGSGRGVQDVEAAVRRGPEHVPVREAHGAEDDAGTEGLPQHGAGRRVHAAEGAVHGAHVEVRAVVRRGVEPEPSESGGRPDGRPAERVEGPQGARRRERRLVERPDVHVPLGEQRGRTAPAVEGEGPPECAGHLVEREDVSVRRPGRIERADPDRAGGDRHAAPWEQAVRLVCPDDAARGRVEGEDPSVPAFTEDHAVRVGERDPRVEVEPGDAPDRGARVRIEGVQVAAAECVINHVDHAVGDRRPTRVERNAAAVAEVSRPDRGAQERIPSPKELVDARREQLALRIDGAGVQGGRVPGRGPQLAHRRPEQVRRGAAALVRVVERRPVRRPGSIVLQHDVRVAGRIGIHGGTSDDHGEVDRARRRSRRDGDLHTEARALEPCNRADVGDAVVVRVEQRRPVGCEE